MASINEDSLDLEVKHKSNGSWHPCHVSLRFVNSKIGIVVNFENSKAEDMIYDKEEALTRLRFRSTPLQNGECSLIKEGDSVLALYKDQSKSTYFDAVIEKPHRVKHSNRVSCRCNFEIKWQKSELRGKTMTIPSMSISKLSSEEMVSNTIFTSFLNAMDPSNAAKSPSSLFCADDANVEFDIDIDIDIDGMLDKQIEQISESVNCDTKNFEYKKAMSGSQSTSRRSTRSQNKQQAEVKSKNVPAEDKTFLSPLAARAALASLMHEQELPVKEIFLSTPKEKVRDNEIPQKSAPNDKKVKNLVRATRSSDKQIKIMSADVKNGSSREKIVSQESTSRIIRSSKGKELEVSESVVKYVVEEDKTFSSPRASATTTGSNEQRKQNSGRATRSSASKGIKILSDEEKTGSSRGKIVSPESTRKTRFSMSKELEVSENEVKKESPPVEKFASPISGKKYEGSKTSVTPSSLTEALESSTGEKFTSPSARLTRSRNKELHTDSEDVTPNKKMRALASPTGTSDKSGGNMEESEETSTSSKKKKSVRRKEILSQKPQLRSSPRLKPSPKT